MQFAIIACALLGVALGQYNAGYTGYPGYQGYQGLNRYQGYNGFPGYQGYQGYKGYQGYQGYPGYQGYRGLPQVSPVKPVLIKAAEEPKTYAPVVPIVTKAAYGAAGPYSGIRSQAQESAPDGSYTYSYQTENGISVAESGVPRSTPEGQEEYVVGEYSYTAPDGQLVSVRYTADKDGFHPEGTHIPTTSGYAGEAYRASAYNRVLPGSRSIANVVVEAKEE